MECVPEGVKRVVFGIACSEFNITLKICLTVNYGANLNSYNHAISGYRCFKVLNMQFGERINNRNCSQFFNECRCIDNDLHNVKQNVYYSPEKVVEAVCEFLSLFKSCSVVSKLI